MKTKDIEALESYISTENAHFNSYTKKILCEAIRNGLFENPETPLRLFDYANSELEKNHEHPLKGVQLFNAEMDKEKLNPAQRLFVYEWTLKYLNNSVFGEEGKEELKLTDIQNLLTSQMEQLKAESQPETPKTKDIRQTLKEIVLAELAALPEMLKTLDAVQRANIVCKLAPFVLPRVESVTAEQDEPKDRTSTGFSW